MRKLIILFLAGFACVGVVTVSGCKKEEETPPKSAIDNAADSAKDTVDDAAGAAKEATGETK